MNGIPFGDALAALDVVAVVDLQARAVLDAMHRALGAVAIDDHHGDVARHDHHVAFRVARDRAVADLHLAVEARLDERLVGELRRAADVEGAHRQLGAGLADRLRRDDADRLAHVDRRAAREVAAVAGAADAVLGLAGQHRPDLHLLDAGGVDRGDVLLDDHPARRDDHLAVAILDPSAAVRPRMRIASVATTVPASTIARIPMPRVEPQSGMVMIESCATSTRRRVR